MKIHSIGNIINIAADVRFNEFSKNILDGNFNTNTIFRLKQMKKNNGWPKDGMDVHIEYEARPDDALYVYVYLNNEIFKTIVKPNTPVNWHRAITQRNANEIFLSDTGVKNMSNSILRDYNDTAIFNSMQNKIFKHELDKKVNKVNPTFNRQASTGTNIPTTNPLEWIEGTLIRYGDLLTSHEGINVSRVNTQYSGTLSAGAYIDNFNRERDGNGRVVCVPFFGQGGTAVQLQCQHRPIIFSDGDNDRGRNCEIVIRSDMYWKCCYNGRQGLKDFRYPNEAREILVQTYTDVGGDLVYARNSPGVVARDGLYVEFQTLHFIAQVPMHTLQDTGYVRNQHDGDRVVSVRHAGEEWRQSCRMRFMKSHTVDAFSGHHHNVLHHYPSIRRVWWR